MTFLTTVSLLFFLEFMMAIWTVGAIAWCNHISPLFKKDHYIQISRIFTWTLTSVLCVHLTAIFIEILANYLLD